LCLVDFLTILAPTFLSSQLMNRRKVWLFPITGKTLSDSNRKNPDSIQKRYILNIIEVGKEIVYKEKGLNPKKNVSVNSSFVETTKIKLQYFTL